MFIIIVQIINAKATGIYTLSSKEINNNKNENNKDKFQLIKDQKLSYEKHN